MTTEKIEHFWQDATADDVARVMAGETVEARFRRSEGSWSGDEWVEFDTTGKRLQLAGWSEKLWVDHDQDRYAECQVYREPSWWTERPDPGPEHRLLGKLPDEELKPGDELWLNDGKAWELSSNAHLDRQQGEGLWYRRRIEPEPKFSVGQTVKVVGPKGKPARHWTAAMDEHIEQVYTVISVQNYPGHPSETAGFYSVKGVVDWAFREDYLEAVEPVESKPALIRRWTVEPGDEIKLPNGRLLIIKQDGFEVTQ
jgi:hypothetical protein